MMKCIRPFKKYPVFTTNGIEECEAMISSTLSDVTILSNPIRDRFQISLATIELGKMSFTYSFFKNKVKLKPGVPDDNFHFVFSNANATKFQIGKRLISVSARKGVILNTDDLMGIERPAGSEVLDIRIPRAEVLHHFEHLTGQYHKSSLDFNNCIDLTSSNGAMLGRMVDYIIQELNCDDFLLTNPDQTRSINHMLLSAILSLPHNKLEQLNQNKGNSIAPVMVRRAEEYMKAHLDELITIIDLLRICDCSRSVLFSSFRNTRGYSPMEFLMEQRLQHAQENLFHPKEADTVSSIAIHSGFTNLGRFAQSYGKRFGERPSTTLKKSIRNRKLLAT